MKSALTRDPRKSRRNFQLETLEGRQLLSLATIEGIAAIVAQAPNKLPVISGHIQGFTAPSPLYFKSPMFFNGWSGHGFTAQVGYANFNGQHLPVASDPTGSTLNLNLGAALFTDKRGEKIFVSYTGTETVTSKSTATFTLTGNITSGTGQFAGATGSFVANGSVKGTHVTLTFALTPTYPTTT